MPNSHNIFKQKDLCLFWVFKPGFDVFQDTKHADFESPLARTDQETVRRCTSQVKNVQDGTTP
jgi:hypothetical protein